MPTERGHEELKELLGAFALDAVPDDERLEVEAHLRGCPICRAEVAEHRETVALLGSSMTAAPEGLWSRVDAALETEPAAVSDQSAEATVLRLPARHVGRWLRGTAAAAAAILIATLGFGVVRQQQRLDQLSAEIGEERVVRAANDALLDPNGRVVQLRGEGGTADVVVLPDGTGYLVRDTLPPLPEDRTYQLWALAGNTTVSAGVLGPNPDVRAFRVNPDIEALAISRERRGGAPAPTRGPIALGEISLH